MLNWIVEQPQSWNGDAAIILAHGAGQGMNSPFMRFFHTELAARGFLSVEFNFEYIEQGRKVPDPQPRMQARYRSVIEEITAAHSPRKIVIGGKSMGGRVASYIAASTPAVSGLIFLGYPLHPPGKTDQLRDAHLYSIEAPMLFISGTKDTFAERPLLEGVVQKLAHHATLSWIEGADHSLQIRRSDRSNWLPAAETIDRWMKDRILRS